MKKLIPIALLALIMNSGCAILFMPKNQKVNVSSSSKESKIYVDNELQGTGSATFKTRKSGTKQVVIQTPGYKDNYCVMNATRRQPGFYVCVAGDALFIPMFYGIYAMVFDFIMPKGFAYEKSTKFAVTGKINTKTEADKYIHISKIGTDLKDKDVKQYDVVVTKKGSQKMDKLMEEAENKKQKQDDKEKKKMKKKDLEKLKEQEEEMKYDDTKFSYNLFKTLKKSGFVDTVNKVFQDENNTLVLDGKITKINLYRVVVGAKRNFMWQQYYKAKVFITWYMKNRYGEVLDSVNAKELSGDFVLYNYFNKTTHSDTHEEKQVDKMIGDAIDNSYLSLYNSSVFKKYLKSYTTGQDAVASEQELKLKRPGAIVTSKSDASQASVIIKREDQGHGSGFAITQDGYILTNYHVIASKVPGKTEKIKVLTSGGDEMDAEIVRYSKERDVALLKVNKSFEKAFLLKGDKEFKNLTDVYTIGAPKSIELGQTVTSGMISNERNANNNQLLQLSMPVNFGNSGGPIFDSNGTLHGIVVSKLVGESTEGISFAIPAYKVPDYLKVSY